jgi:RNA polymerase sigma factor (TIGR02999 family)
MSEVTQILEAARAGDEAAATRLFELVYAELRQVAARKMAGEAAGHTLQPTALVHEAWLRLGADAQPHWRNRAHFFAAAGEAMRRILVERARRRQAARRGGGIGPADMDGLPLAAPDRDECLLELDDALERFAAVEPQKAALVKLRYFAGLRHEEAAEALGISTATASRWWLYAKAWLQEAMQPATPEG